MVENERVTAATSVTVLRENARVRAMFGRYAEQTQGVYSPSRKHGVCRAL
jgi:hypothetical protein